MSPEQVRGEPVDHRSDIFAFGLVLHEMIPDRRAFTGPSAVEMMNAILNDDPALLGGTNRFVPGGTRAARRPMPAETAGRSGTNPRRISATSSRRWRSTPDRAARRRLDRPDGDEVS